MSGISGIINWDNSPVDINLLSRMTDIISHRGPNGLYKEVDGNKGFGFAKLILKESEKMEIQPLWTPDKSYAIVADSRLYNQMELIAKLGNSLDWCIGEPSDAAIILSGYVKWNSKLLNELDGDFAFAVWDEKRKRVFAARDPFGLKPFFYYCSPHKFLFGSEPKQFLIHPDVPVEPDDLVVGEYLLNQVRHVENTFYKGINRIKPSHYLVATKHESIQVRYWNPDPENESHYSRREYFLEQFKDLFTDAINKRLKTSYPVIGQLSGGVDSSSIAVIANNIYQKKHNELPRFETLSAVFNNLACDETFYIDCVSRNVSFNNHKFCPLNGDLSEGLIEDIRQKDSPLVSIHRGIFSNCADLMSDKGARILLTGLGGDELVYEEYYLQDLAARRNYLLLLNEAWNLSESMSSFGWLLKDSLGHSAPELLKKIHRLIKKDSQSRLSKLFRKEFIDNYNCHSYSAPLESPGFKSKTQDAVLQSLNYPSICGPLEALESIFAYRGCEVRHPFFDRPLAEFVLSIPFEMRPLDGQWKSLLRQSLAEELPREVINRKTKTLFDSYNNYIFEKSATNLKRMLFDTEFWASDSYISRKNAKNLFDNLIVKKDNKSLLECNLLWNIAKLELWLRNILCYN